MLLFQISEKLLALLFRQDRFSSALSGAPVFETVRAFFVVPTDDSPDSIGCPSNNERRFGGAEGIALSRHEMENVPSFSFKNILAGTVTITDVCR